jgi:predicted nucleic acid-binding protein
MKVVQDTNIIVSALLSPREKFMLDKELVNLIINFISKEGEYILSEFQKIQFIDEDDKAVYDVFKAEYVDFLITGKKNIFSRRKV